MDHGRNATKDRKRFALALAMYLIWVSALGVLSVLSGYRPTARPAANEGR